ncbi:hypothetical protein Desdi_0313 [Desulfitobacterium dichloroeliminans LMG P-21439]|uniref:Uncharacterized protein n=1 Tax=Desulfitobacterium dichloroeliminans (strain LMG P-21439 / DCA1) TaxID=871963 RepID=L0F5B6_DESDL|nr:hypothetical protein [Desulfitobacterium dichloroeliminans]AGA67861.1 hypothetical protein Desdi_0313 [Desulfitobacterium dichloroeliminans LMG P-21439]
MQNRYVGDLGDFGKYALLRRITKTGLTLGVNWYLAPDENHNSDGKHISYLKDKSYRNYDEELYDFLKYVVDNGKRNVLSVQESIILPRNTAYYDSILDLTNELDPLKRRMRRLLWHNAALNKLNDCEIVFLDPDNGLQVKSVSLTERKGNKYIGLDELKDYYKLGKSIIFYNHRERKQEEEYLDKFRKLQHDPGLTGAKWFALKFVGGTIRDYIFVLRPTHFYLVEEQCKALLNTAWKANFSLLCI